VLGQFNRITGTILYDPGEHFGSSVKAEIDVSSITTGIRKRDDHLLSSDFFDAANHPLITFQSTRIAFEGPNKGKIFGDLTIRGITHPVIMDAEFSGPVESPYGGETTMGFSASTTINRFDYQVNWNVIMEDGGSMVDKEVKITIDVEADLSE
jgi:polyisoprenoid-binding protein YceI